MSRAALKNIRTQRDVADLIEEIGFLPFFNNAMPGYGFSIEELCAREKWFADDDGPWEWKGPLIRQTGAAYGKFFRGKAGFVSAEWFADFANLRGGLMAFDERWGLGLASEGMRVIYELLEDNGPLLTKELRRMGGFGTRKRGQRPGFDAALTKLQMMGYVTTLDIEHEVDRAGRPYGWGVARMALTSWQAAQAHRLGRPRQPRQSAIGSRCSRRTFPRPGPTRCASTASCGFACWDAWTRRSAATSLNATASPT